MNGSWSYPSCLAHRGGGTLAPENTLAGMRCAASHGFQGVEFDVMLAKDGVPVLMHDPQFGRTVLAPGGVPDYTAAQLATLDAGGWLAPAFRGEPVCTLSQVLAYCTGHGLWMNIEIKPSSDAVAAETGAAVAALTRAFLAQPTPGGPDAGADADGGTDARNGIDTPAAASASSPSSAPSRPPPPLFSSFSFDALRAAQAAAPEIARGWLVERIEGDWQVRLRALQAVSLHVDHRHLTQVQAAAVGQAGYGLLCYTVNRPARAEQLMAWGVDAFCTDRLDLFAASGH